MTGRAELDESVSQLAQKEVSLDERCRAQLSLTSRRTRDLDGDRLPPLLPDRESSVLSAGVVAVRVRVIPTAPSLSQFRPDGRRQLLADIARRCTDRRRLPAQLLSSRSCRRCDIRRRLAVELEQRAEDALLQVLIWSGIEARIRASVSALLAFALLLSLASQRGDEVCDRRRWTWIRLWMYLRHDRRQ